MSIINLRNISLFVVICLRVVAGSIRVLIVSRLRQGIVRGHAHLVPGFAYIGPSPPESQMLESTASATIRDTTL